jgi:4-hydroxy-3-polyprenylbenzoate decarboxylase
MPFPDLQSFLNQLERDQDLHRVKVEVDPEYEITEIAIRAVREEKPAIVFERVKGSPYPVAINVLATARRIETALGRHPEQIGSELLSTVERLKKPSLQSLWDARRTLLRGLGSRISRVSNAPSQTVAEEPDLSKLPVLKCWPEDGGRFITFGLVLTSDPLSGERNLGLYRLHVHGPAETGIHWQIQKGGGFHYHVAERQRQALPVAVTIGTDPCLLLAAASPLPEGMDELVFAAYLRGSPTKLARARRIDAWVPANADFILEGEVPIDERRMEGPFGDHFGHYSNAAPFPVLKLKTITRRQNPVYLATVVGKPPQEDRAIGEAVGAMLGPLIRTIHHEVRDLAAYFETGFHNLLVVSVEERYAKESVRAALGLIGTGQLSLTKCAVMVDESVNVRDISAVLRAIRDHFEAAEDFILLPGVPLDTLDFTSGRMNLGSKMILDATGHRAVGPGNTPEEIRRTPATPLSAEDHERMDKFLADLPKRLPDVIESRVFEDCWLTVRVRSGGRNVVEELVREPLLAGLKVVAAVSEDVPLDDATLHWWGVFTRFDAARDVVFTEAKLTGAWPGYRGRLGIDATFKEGYPKPLEMNPEIIEKVDRRWNEYWS